MSEPKMIPEPVVAVGTRSVFVNGQPVAEFPSMSKAIEFCGKLRDALGMTPFRFPEERAREVSRALEFEPRR